MMPLVSVCIPAYNCEKYIGEAVQSVLAQSYPSVEIIIVDDGSTDGTLNAIRAIDDKRIKCISSANRGAAAARNLAYQNSTGQFIIFFDADDLLSVDFVRLQMDRMGQRNDVIILSGWGRFYNDNLNTFKKEYIPFREMSLTDWINTYWYQCNPMTAPGRSLIPRWLLNKAGLWNEELSLNDDMEFYTRLFIEASGILLCDEALLYYRSGVGGLSGYKGKKAYQSLLKSIRVSIDHALQSLNTDNQIRQSCANMLQSFIYELYPDHTELIDEAQKQIDNLRIKPNLKFMAGGLSSYLLPVLGWKFTKRIKLLFK